MEATHRTYHNGMVKVARCGSITCWRIASAVLIVLGLVCLATGFGVMFSGDLSMADCQANDNYACGSGCFDSSDTYCESDIDVTCSLISSGSGTANAYKFCKHDQKPIRIRSSLLRNEKEDKVRLVPQNCRINSCMNCLGHPFTNSKGNPLRAPRYSPRSKSES